LTDSQKVRRPAERDEALADGGSGTIRIYSGWRERKSSPLV